MHVETNESSAFIEATTLGVFDEESAHPALQEGTEMPTNVVLDLVDFAESAPVPLKPEDLTTFALTEEFIAGVTKKVLTTVPVRKPSKDAFVRTTTTDSHWKIYSILELRGEEKTYIVAPAVAAALEMEGETTLAKARLVPTIDRRGNYFLWPLKVTDRELTWHLSALRAAELAKSKWVRIQANMSAGAYDTCVAEMQSVDPIWPEEDMTTILKIAFKDKVISSHDHPVLKELRGDF